MMKKNIGILLLLCAIGATVFAHHQMIYTPASVIESNEVNFKITFTHPFVSGHTMDIGKNEQGEIKGFEKFFSVHKGKIQDLLPSLKKTSFSSAENSALAFDLVLDKTNGFRGGGDWALIGVPYPYFEEAEDGYIQQITKVFINKAGLATDWKNRCAEGYPEILPLVKPYDVWVGGVFRGVVVDANGKPAPNIEIEIAYINYDVNMEKSAFEKTPKTNRGDAIILTDSNGAFSFVPTESGYWGFSALGAGNKKEFSGKALSQDAVLWIEASLPK
ncbi:DUF4198 domain-containing protein [Treponema phagedenis]|uniref:DUF4198 domain-containing protein n=2 Tax=Treponema phagedenis TaxID=162 RepID=UPI0001F6413E|nr:DUF4198 domain-containing protein [Treponema phagedenis]EFW37691.1 hypothetical protein HMPREF9554_01814 [Treponema phagedenis F0421]